MFNVVIRSGKTKKPGALSRLVRRKDKPELSIHHSQVNYERAEMTKGIILIASEAVDFFLGSQESNIKK